MTYRFSRRADQDLDRLFDEGIDRFGLEQANGYLDGLLETCGFLAQFPQSARERRDIDPPVRTCPDGAHVIVYRAERTGILIVRIRHGRENWFNRPV